MLNYGIWFDTQSVFRLLYLLCLVVDSVISLEEIDVPVTLFSRMLSHSINLFCNFPQQLLLALWRSWKNSALCPFYFYWYLEQKAGKFPVSFLYDCRECANSQSGLSNFFHFLLLFNKYYCAQRTKFLKAG